MTHQNPRLTVSDPDGGLAATVYYDRQDGTHDGYHFSIHAHRDLETEFLPFVYYSGDDLRVPHEYSTELEAMRCLGDFLGAYKEAIEYAERTNHERDDVDSANLFGTLYDDVGSMALGSLVEAITITVEERD